MFHPFLSDIQWIDIPTGKAKEYTLSGFYQKYAHRQHMLDSTAGLISVVEFYGDIIVRDFEGWTELDSITKVINPSERWVQLGIMGNNIFLDPSDSTIIPVYDPGTQSYGYHGERKYKITETKINDIQIGDVIRNIDKENAPEGFSEVVDIKKDMRFETEEEVCFGYKIKTKSGFVNISNLQMFAK